MEATITRMWRDPPGDGLRILDAALAPLEWLYRMGNGIYHGIYSAGAVKSARAAVPVISIGNIVVGGAGKTPLAGWLIERLRRNGYRPALIHGGYGADEPDLHRELHPETPVIVDRDREAGARRAVEAGADLIVLDDGFQHRRLRRNLDIVLIPAENWSARPRLLPRGPWRESPRSLVRADVVAVTRKTADGETAERVAADVEAFAPGVLTVVIALRPAGWHQPGGEKADGPPAGEVLAVTAIARPDAFLVNAREAGAAIVDSQLFPDHHAYTSEDAERILARAGKRELVTTAKDAVKLRKFPLVQSRLWVLEQRIVPENGCDALVDRIRQAATHATMPDAAPGRNAARP